MSNRRKPKYGKPVSSHDKPITGSALVHPKPVGGRMKTVVLDPVVPGVEPPYCTHGKTTCYVPDCNDWCWLGCESYEVVASGEAVGMCLPCANKHLKGAQPIGHLNDTLHHG